MRVSDRSLQTSFLRNITLTRERLADVQEKMTTKSKINRPSDSPLGTSRIMRFANQLQNMDAYQNNISRSRSLVNSSISSMDGMLAEIEKVLSDIASSNDATLGNSKETFAANIDSSLSQLLSLANSEFDGNYLFSGTNLSTKPFALNGAGTAVTAQSSDLGGDLGVRISKTLEQKVNITGKELFQAVLTDYGNLDSGEVPVVGPYSPATAFTNDTTQIYNADGTEYTLTTYYSKTAANTYQIDFTVDDGSGAVSVPDSFNLKFDPTSGELTSITNNTTSKEVSDIQIKLGGEKIDMLVDVSNMTESTSATSFKKSMNQKTDIFNTLIAVRDQIRSGQGVEDNQVEVIENFHSLLLDKMSLAGSISNRLDDTELLLTNQSLETNSLLSKEKDVDAAKALIDIENQQYTLNLSYKISSMILPKSIMDFI